MSKGLVEKTLFNIISVGSLVALSSCAQPVTETPTATAKRNLAELAQSHTSQGRFKILARAVQATGLNEQLATAGPYTVFAPTDAAFEALPKATLDNLLKPENKQKLVKLLAYQIVPGQITSSQLTSGPVKTLEGTPAIVKVDSASKTITINGAKVIQADIPASNGIVHAVDKVVLPPNFLASLNAKPTQTPKSR